MGKLPPGKTVVAGVVVAEVKEELRSLQRERGLTNLSQAVGFVLTEWYKDRRKAAPRSDLKLTGDPIEIVPLSGTVVGLKPAARRRERP